MLHMRRNQTNTNTQNRQSRQRQRPPILKRSTFQGFRQYPGKVRPCSLTNSRNNHSNPRFRSFSRSLSRLDLEVSINQLNVIIVIIWVTQQITVTDVRIRISYVDNLIQVKETITEILKGFQTTDQTLDIEQPTFLSVELIFQSHQCIQIYRQGINDKH